MSEGKYSSRGLFRYSEGPSAIQMPEVSKETIGLLQYLLPGFLAAWVIYATTSHRRPTGFEQVVQALILSLVIGLVVVIERWCLFLIGHHILSLGPWNKSAELMASTFTAVTLGAGCAYVSNTDSFHSFLRKWGLTTRSSYPSEWFQVFHSRQCYVTIHLSGDRRLMGWPRTWSSHAEGGHLYIEQAAWLDVGKTSPLIGVSGVLIDAEEIEFIEFLEGVQNGESQLESESAPTSTTS